MLPRKLVNSQTESNSTLFLLASGEFPAETALQGKCNAVFNSHLLILLYFKSMSAFLEKVVFIHHVLPYLKTKTIFVLSSQLLNEAIDYYCMGELFTF